MVRCIGLFVTAVLILEASAVSAAQIRSSVIDGFAGPVESHEAAPFSFTCGGRPNGELLPGWEATASSSEARDETRVLTEAVYVWTDTSTGLSLTRTVRTYPDYGAAESVLTFTNTGSADTPVIENVQALDIRLSKPISAGTPYLLHRTNGAPSNPTDFEVTKLVVDRDHPVVLSAGGGRSSNKDFPFFKIDTGEGSLIVAVGWSGQWQARIECLDDRQLHVTAGLELTHFKLHPGESVRSPRILIMHWPGDTLEANAKFRELIREFYAAKRSGNVPDPILFMNTCFTRGGGWLNECNEQNQISLIEAYAPMGLEALITDAGWFAGGWPNGAGNWDPRKDAYPNGMGPVAAAAKKHGMVYGLWFEPERVMAGTDIRKRRPEWCLAAQPDQREGTFLLNFGLPEVQDYFFNIVKGFMDLPGFRFYRQDFNMDPLPYWRFNDAPDRQGITEMKYIEGLYAYWDRIARTWPDSIREECASGGRRIDLETVRRMHLHQESDYWFDNETDQCQVYGLSQYLPNNLFDTPLIRLDDYSFHSTMATSLIPGWIADEPGFDTARATRLLKRYNEVRRLLTGAWYPLLPYTRAQDQWMAMQWHRPDLNEGLILAFRRAQSPYTTVDIPLHGLDPDATYELTHDISGKKQRARGSGLMKSWRLMLGEKRSSDMVVYKKVE